MSVWIARHGQAVAPRFEIADGARWLTAAGRAAARATGAQLADAGVQFTSVVTSPLVRAVQTAELLAAAVGFGGEIIADAGLAPDGEPDDVLARLGGYVAPMLLVSHEPLVSALWRSLTGTGGGFGTGEIRRVDAAAISSPR